MTETKKISVVGIGKLGLELATIFSRHYQVVGIDRDMKRVNEAIVRGMRGSSTNMHDVLGSDLIFIAVNTSRHLDDLYSVVHSLRFYPIVITSTVPPGTYQNLPLSVVYNPLFVRQGTVAEDILNPPLVLIGSWNSQAADMVETVWRQCIGEAARVVSISPPAAEIAKMALNAWLCTKIHFGNILGDICRKYDTNPQIVLDALSCDSRVNTSYMKPGMGFGGPCLPVDLLAFNQCAHDPVLEALYMANASQPKKMAYEIASLKSKCVAVLGLTYKMCVPIIEESAGWALANELEMLGIRVQRHDPVLEEWAGTPLDEAIAGADTVVIALPYPEYKDKDYGERRVINPWR